MNNRITDHISDAITNKLTSICAYAFSFLSGTAGLLSLNEWAILVGILLAFVTFFVNWFFQRRNTNRRDDYLNKKEDRELEIHQLEKAILRKRLGDDND